jgi:hypothetical protein
MCPACLTTLALIPVGAGSAGGVNVEFLSKSPPLERHQSEGRNRHTPGRGRA